MRIYRWSIWVAGAAALLALASAARAVVVADYAVQVSARVQTNPPQITLAWPADPDATGYTLYRKSRDATAWGTATTLATNATGYVDSNVAIGEVYEYRIVKSALEGTTSYTGYGYLLAGIEAPLIEARGKVLLIVERTYADALSNELRRLQLDLTGDGWTVLRREVWRTNTPPQVKAIITNDYYADPQNVKAVFLFGRVPVPYSGLIAPDGHGDHTGAWAADGYYADVNGTWTDSSVNYTNSSRADNRNVPGDGKFDQSTFPSDLELQVGRVDFYNMTSFPQGERELLRRYLGKHHYFRQGRLTAERRAIVDDNFGTYSGGFAQCAYRSFPAFFGHSNIFARDWFTTLATNSYLWGYACGGGSYTSESGVGTTTSFVLTNTHVIFTMHFGSYFGDYDAPNNLMRAQLANAAGGLTCAWAGRPFWQFHHMAMGEPIGYSTLQSQNQFGVSRLYLGTGYYQWVHVALLGDPTLRMHMVPPPAALVVGPDNGGRLLRWRASPDSVLGYHVYGAASADGPFQRLNSQLIADTNFLDTAAASQVYMVRAVKLETSASGTYYNASQGIFENAANNLTPPLITLASPTNGTILPLPPQVRLAVEVSDANNDVARVDYYTNGVLAGSAAQWPFDLSLTNPWVGHYAISAVVTDEAGMSATSSVANLTVTYSITSLVPPRSVWKYEDTGADLGVAWRAPGYDDSAWSEGPAQLGFGDGDEATVINTNRQRITTYFRKTFVVPPEGTYMGLTVRLLRDDGGVVYLNGVEVFRSNMPTNQPINWSTQAAANALTADESTQFYDQPVDRALLHPGENTLAVEIHQYGANSSDLSFDLELVATNLPAPLNTPPLVSPSPIPTVELPEDTASAPIYFVVGDAESWAEGLTLSAQSSNPALAPANSFFFGGTGSNRFLVITPAADQNGSAVIELMVSDGLTNTITSFNLLVTPQPDPPQISLAGLTNGSLLSLSSLVLTGLVYDPDNDPVRAEFFANEMRLGAVSNAPYVITWSNAVPGYYLLQARATDATGLASSSAPVFVTVLGGGASLVPTGAVWRYYDQGQDLGTSWRAPEYDDSAWPAGRGPLGYGDANGWWPATTNQWGPNSSAKYPTTYYRHRFALEDAASLTNLWLRLQRDDGAIIYLNGLEVFRSNMPTGQVTYATLAAATISGADEAAWHLMAVDAALLREGTNCLAAEVHQSTASSSDLFFNLELKADRALRPPALQAAPEPGAGLKFTWPSWAGGLSLWSASNLAPPILWMPVTNGLLTTNGQVILIVPLEKDRLFFQLRSP